MITPLYLASKATRPRLRVGVLLDGGRVPRYVATILEDIARCNFADVQLAVFLEQPQRRLRLSGLAQDLSLRADRFAGRDFDPLGEVAPVAAFSGVNRLVVTPGAQDKPWLLQEAFEEIRQRDL